MAIKYRIDEEIMRRIYDIVKTLDEDQGHVRLSGVYAVRSYGSQSRGVLARCHALGKIWQLALGIKAVYIIEVINERFEKLSKEDQDRVLVHEIMHIPKSFGGGFKHHNTVNHRTVEKMYKKYVQIKEKKDGKEGKERRWF